MGFIMNLPGRLQGRAIRRVTLAKKGGGSGGLKGGGKFLIIEHLWARLKKKKNGGMERSRRERAGVVGVGKRATIWGKGAGRPLRQVCWVSMDVFWGGHFLMFGTTNA